MISPALAGILEPLMNLSANRGGVSAVAGTATDGTLTLTLTDGALQVQLSGDDLRNTLATLEKVGEIASQARAACDEHTARQTAEARERAQQQTLERYATPTADVFDLVDTGHGWALPEEEAKPRLLAFPASVLREGYRPVPVAAALTVTTPEGAPLGTIHISAANDITSQGAHERTLLDESILGRTATRELAHANPWRQITLPDPQAPLREHLKALAEAAPIVADWVAAMGRAVDRVDGAKEQQEVERVEWARASRSRDRIPTAALAKWMADNSDVSHLANGLAVSGYRVVAEQVVGRTRPAHLDPSKRRKGVGAKEILFVARLVHKDVHRRTTNQFQTFYDRQVESLREALPGCVVKVPEDRKAVFVAFNDPAYVQAMDAALVEWVLLGDAG